MEGSARTHGQGGVSGGGGSDGQDAAAAAAAGAVDGASLIAEMQHVLAQVPESISLYRNELEKLLTASVKSQESEQRLVQRTKEILGEIQGSHEVMLRDVEEETEAVMQKNKTKLELEAVRQQISAAQQLETDKQEKLNDLRSSIALLQDELSTLAMPSANASADDILLNEEQELRIASMKKQRAELARDVEAKTSSLQDLRQETSNLYALVQEAEARNATLEEQHSSVMTAIQDKQQLADKEVRRKNALEKVLKTRKAALEALLAESAVKEEERRENDETLRGKELQLREAKQKMEKYLKQYDALFRTTHQLTAEMQAQWQKNVELHKLNTQVDQELQAQEAQVAQQTQVAAKLEKLGELAKEQLLELEGKRVACDHEREQIKLELSELVNGAIEREHREADVLRKKLDELLREREVLNKMLVKATDRTQATFDLLKIRENTRKNLQNEISGLQAQVKKQRADIQRLVGEREKYEAQATRATKKFMTALEEAKLQDLQVVSLQHKIVEGEAKLKQQQTLYEAVRADRNLYSKQLIESQEAIGEMKRTFKIMTHQIEQLKEEITAKDHALVKEHFDHHRVDKEKELLRHELLRIRKQILSSEQILSNQELEATKLTKIIREADDEKQRQLKEYGAVVHDRDTLRQQLMQRNDELRVLYEKIKIQKSTLAKGHAQFADKQHELRTLQSRVQTLTLERDASSNQLSHEASLQKETLALEKDLLQEKTKIRALSEELDHPLNVHRWRKLEGSDPQRFELIRKLQALQRKLIYKYDEALAKDAQILDKEKLYVELKTVLARQPGAEVAEQLAVYRETLKGKQNQMKQMEEELEMYKMQVNEYRRDQATLEAERKRLQRDWLQKQLTRGAPSYESAEDDQEQQQQQQQYASSYDPSLLTAVGEEETPEEHNFM